MLQIKKGLGKVKSSKNPGLSFDTWFFNKLIDYGLSPERDCCSRRQFMFQPGTYLKQPYSTNNKSYFNLEKWLRRILIQLNVLTPEEIEELCCPTKQTLFLHTGNIYFTDEDLDKSSLDFRVKLLLTEWDVPFTDLCCEDTAEFYVFTYDFSDLGNIGKELYVDLSLADCNTNYTALGEQYESYNYKVNGTEYITSTNTYTLDGPSLDDIMTYYVGLNVPGATYRWVAADTRLYNELYKDTTLESNVAYLVVELPPNSTVESTFTFKTPQVFKHTNRVVNTLSIFNTSTHC